jgi:hypothetical protein
MHDCRGIRFKIESDCVLLSFLVTKTNFVASRFYSGERQAGVLLLTLLHNLPKLFARRMSWFFVERFFQTVGLVLAWGTFTGWRVLYREVFIRACQFRDNVLCCCSKTSVQKSFLTQIKMRGSKLIKRFKGSKLRYGSYVERFKVNKLVQRFKVTHATKKS